MMEHTGPTLYSGDMANPDSSSRGGRSAPGVVIQSLYLLLGMLALSATAGALIAAFFLPAVGFTSSAARDGVELFDSFPEELETAPLNEASRIEASDGSLLATFYSENRISVPLEEISPHVQNAVISIEDRRFYEHGGVDMRGTVRALTNNLTGGGTQGGSTLTQQYVKNALLMDAVQRGDDEARQEAIEQTYGRKAREMKLAIALEKQQSKDEILNGYLNLAQFGPSQYGVETASQHYFSKSAKDLDPGEAALLAGITNSPNGNDPVANPEKAKERRNSVLKDMRRDGHVSQEDFEKYTEQTIKSMLKVKNVQAGCADAGTNGFFCDYVTRSLLNDPEFAPTYEERRQLLYGGGLTIRTTLDKDKQKTAQDIVDRKVPREADNGFGHSITTVEPGSGKVLVMAQNRTFNPHDDAGDGETALNYSTPAPLGGGNGFPVGSTFKPFVLAEWLAQGKSVYETVPTGRKTMHEFPAQCLGGGRWYETQGYDPDNAVSVDLSPRETVLDSTKFSVNTSYTNMAQQLDLCSIADQARSMGAIPAADDPQDPETWDKPVEDMYGQELAPSVVVLGELRISALDMAAAYATVASGGEYCRPTGIAEVLDSSGEKLPVTGKNCEQVLDKKEADTLAWVLQQDLEDPRATGKGKTVDGHVAGGKTGTSGKQFHTWYVGFTRQMSTAVWFGHPTANESPGGFAVDGEMLQRGKVWGNTVSLPTWQEYMTKVHRGLPNEKFPAAPARPPSLQDDSEDDGGDEGAGDDGGDSDDGGGDD